MSESKLYRVLDISGMNEQHLLLEVAQFRKASHQFSLRMLLVFRGPALGTNVLYIYLPFTTLRHASSCTQDPALAEELALHGEPSGACGVVFKIRSMDETDSMIIASC